MIGALNTAATGMAAQEKQIESISNNLSNVNTTGFKKARTEFQDLLYETIREPGVVTSQTSTSPAGIQRGSGTQVVATQKIMEGGQPKITNRDLDVALDGLGFLRVQLPDGSIAYTRDGSLKMGPTGRLENAKGYPIVPEITIPPNVQSISFSENGIVTAVDPSNNPQQVGQFQLATFMNAEGLKNMGGGLYLATVASGPESVTNPGQEGAAQIVQHHLETSNVNPVEEMVQMIGTQRAYEMNSKVIQAVDQMLQTTASMK